MSVKQYTFNVLLNIKDMLLAYFEKALSAP